eukprot:15441211-Alexandrium_andersonii.AAC.1
MDRAVALRLGVDPPANVPRKDSGRFRGGRRRPDTGDQVVNRFAQNNLTKRRPFGRSPAVES